MEIDAALEWVAQRRTAVLITIRSDGRPQSSDVAYLVEDGNVVVSLTADRAKTANLRRDPRCVVHVTEPSSWSYVSLDGTVELTPVTTGESDDATSDAVVAYYESVSRVGRTPTSTGRGVPRRDDLRGVASSRSSTPRSAVGQF